jgi:hypothetical protein
MNYRLVAKSVFLQERPRGYFDIVQEFDLLGLGDFSERLHLTP